MACILHHTVQLGLISAPHIIIQSKHWQYFQRCQIDCNATLTRDWLRSTVALCKKAFLLSTILVAHLLLLTSFDEISWHLPPCFHAPLVDHDPTTVCLLGLSKGFCSTYLASILGSLFCDNTDFVLFWYFAIYSTNNLEIIGMRELSAALWWVYLPFVGMHHVKLCVHLTCLVCMEAEMDI